MKRNIGNVFPVDIWCQNNVVSTSLRRNNVASTLIRRHFYVMCPLGPNYVFHINVLRILRYQSFEISRVNCILNKILV